MEAQELLKVKVGTVLVISGIEREIVEVLEYKGTTSGWTNLISRAETGREVVLEISGKEARVYLEMQDLPLDAETMKPINDIDVDVIVVPDSRRFELDEGSSRARTNSITSTGTKLGKLRFTVFIPEDDEESKELFSVD